MEVHRTLGCGFLESVYHEALAIEFDRRGIPFARERAIPVTYKDVVLSCQFRADFLCYQAVIVEIKALARLSGTEEGQLINYLKASGHGTGLLLNFGTPSLEHRRFALSR